MRALLFLLVLLVGATPARAASCDAPMDRAARAQCIGDELRASDQRINDIFGTLLNARDGEAKTALRDEQRRWLRERDEACRLDRSLADRERWFAAILADSAMTLCVVRFTEARLGQLERMAAAPAVVPASPAATPVPPPRLPENLSFIDPLPPVRKIALVQPKGPVELPAGRRPEVYRWSSQTYHSSGKWYYEVLIRPAVVASLGPSQVQIGVHFRTHNVYSRTILLSSAKDFVEAIRVGVAVDVDRGAVYFRFDGRWDALPGTTNSYGPPHATTLATVQTTLPIDSFLTPRALLINLGQRPFDYPVPEGYRPFIEN